MLRKLAFATVAAFSVLYGTLSAHAQDYPSRPIKLVIPLAAGGGTDALGRVFAQALSTRLGQSVVVENKAGAAATIGADYVAKSKPDGYTLLFSPSDSISLAVALKPDLTYKIPEDFAFIGRVAANSLAFAVNSNQAMQSLQDVIASAKANPGKVRYGSSGVGSVPHLGTVLLMNGAGIDMVHVPFSGAGPGMTSLMGGFIDLYLASPSGLEPQVQAGKLRVIATTGETRNRLFPDAPTVAEAAIPDFLVVVWFGVVAPAETPESVQAILRKAVEDTVKEPEFAERVRKLGFDTYYASSQEFRSFTVKETARWKDVVQKANIKLEN